jgi:hypothetical protein
VKPSFWDISNESSERRADPTTDIDHRVDWG